VHINSSFLIDKKNITSASTRLVNKKRASLNLSNGADYTFITQQLSGGPRLKSQFISVSLIDKKNITSARSHELRFEPISMKRMRIRY
jgi:hypothetical protein